MSKNLEHKHVLWLILSTVLLDQIVRTTSLQFEICWGWRFLFMVDPQTLLNRPLLPSMSVAHLCQTTLSLSLELRWLSHVDGLAPIPRRMQSDFLTRDFDFPSSTLFSAVKCSFTNTGTGRKVLIRSVFWIHFFLAVTSTQTAPLCLGAGLCPVAAINDVLLKYLLHCNRRSRRWPHCSIIIY